MAVLDTIVISDGLAILFVMALYFMDRKHGAAWLVASLLMAAQAVVMWFAPSIHLLNTLFQLYAALLTELTVLIGAIAGMLAGYLGWQHGKHSSSLPVQTCPI